MINILKKEQVLLIVILFSTFSFGLNAQSKLNNSNTDSVKVLLNKSDNEVLSRSFNASSVNNTAAISTVLSTNLSKTSTNISNSLFGVLPGLTVKQSTGEPGYDEANLNIRGIGTYGNIGNGGFNTAVIYVDGFQAEPNYFNDAPLSAIESITVLKDAASLVTFGMNGSNGVIWVITKKGENCKPKVSFNYHYGISSPENINKPLNSYQYATLYDQAVSNDHGNVWTPYYTADQLQAYKNGTTTDVDWYSKVVRSSAPYSNGNLKFTGGDFHTRYNILFDFYNQQGLYNVANSATTSNEKFNKYSIAGNLAFDWNIFEAKVDINARLQHRKYPNYVSNLSTNTIWSDLAKYPNNIYPVFDDTLQQYFSGTSLYPNNPVGSLNGLGWASSLNRWVVANFSLKEKLDFITKGLYLNQAFSFTSNSLSTYNKTSNYARYINGVTTTIDKTSPIAASALGAYSQQDWKQAILTLGYDKLIGKNVITSVVNYHQSYATH